VRALPSGKFQARYIAPDGTRRTLGSFLTAKDAARAIALKEAEIQNHDWLDERKSEVTFRAFAETVFEHKWHTLKGATVNNHRSLLNRQLLPLFGHKRLCDLNPMAIDQWFNSQARTVNRKHAYSLLHNYLGHAVKWGYIKANPCMVDGGFSDPSEPRPAFGLEDFRKVLVASERPFRDILLVTFSGHLRASEVIGLNVGDFDPQTGVLTVSRSFSQADGLKAPKNGNTKTVTLLDQGADALREYLKRHPGLPDAPMFRSERGNRIGYRWLGKEWNATCERAGLTGMRFHDIRHVSLTHIAHTGADLAVIMARGGHRSVNAALRYQAATSTRDREIALLASRLFG